MEVHGGTSGSPVVRPVACSQPPGPAGGGRGSFRPQAFAFDTVGINPADTIE
jgi:hypothetical protein